MEKIMRKMMGLATAFLLSTNVVTAQTSKVVEELNKSGFWMPYVQWLSDDGRMNGYLSRVDKYSIGSLEHTLESLGEDYKRAEQLLAARRDIVGKKKGKKATALLAKHFKDVEAAERAFLAAQQAQERIKVLRGRIESELRMRADAVMPAGELKLFSYHFGNGFAGTHFSIELQRNDNGHGGKLTRLNENRMFGPEEEQAKPEVAEVEDSVFQRVRDIIEQGQLYKVGHEYMPDFDITDASSWSLGIYFEGGSISSGGYAVGPDYGDALNEVIKYLGQLLKKDEGQE